MVAVMDDALHVVDQELPSTLNPDRCGAPHPKCFFSICSLSTFDFRQNYRTLMYGVVPTAKMLGNATQGKVIAAAWQQQSKGGSRHFRSGSCVTSTAGPHGNAQLYER
jgi:hypothetical protein